MLETIQEMLLLSSKVDLLKMAGIFGLDAEVMEDIDSTNADDDKVVIKIIKNYANTSYFTQLEVLLAWK